MDDLSYLGGFVDGEGCISAGRSGPTSYHVMLSVSQLNPAPLVLLQKHFGGRVIRVPDSRGYRTQVIWRVSSRQAKTVLEALLPYLIVKYEEAVVAIELQSRLMSAVEATREAELAGRAELYEQLKAIKHRSYDHVFIEQVPMVAPDRVTVGPKLLRVKKPKVPKPKHVRVKVAAPIRSAQGRSGAPRKGESKKPDAATLESQYRERGPNHLARTYGVTRQTIYNWLDSYGIPRMGRSAASEHRRLAALKAVWKLENQDGSTA